MSGKASGWAWDQRGLSVVQKCVLACLADHAGKDGSNAYPGQELIVAETGASLRAVRNALAYLEKEKLLVRVGNAQGGRGKTVVWHLDLERRHLMPPSDEESEDKGGTKAASDASSPIRLARAEPEPSVSSSVGRRESVGTDVVDSVDFNEFWRLYPARNGKKVEKAKASKIWGRLTPAKQAAALIGAKNYAASGQWPKDAHRWLRDGLWDDWQTPAEAGPGRDIFAGVKEFYAEAAEREEQG